MPSADARETTSRCLVCNEDVDLAGVGSGWAVALAKRRGEDRDPSIPLQYVMHDECARAVANPQFDFAGVERRHEQRSEMWRRHLQEADKHRGVMWLWRFQWFVILLVTLLAVIGVVALVRLVA